MRYIFLFIIFCSSSAMAQYQEATITRTVATNSIFPRQFPSMTIRKMNDNEYWIFDSLGTNTIFHRQFPTYIVRKQNMASQNQKLGVYRTISTNTVFVNQFPERYISDLKPEENIRSETQSKNITFDNTKTTLNSFQQEHKSSYTYSRSLKSDKTRAYIPETPE